MNKFNSTSFLRELRLKSGLTQTEVAKELGYSTSQYVSNFERSLSYPPVSTLSKLASLYGVDPIYLKKQYLKFRVSAFEARLKKKLGLC